MVNVFTGSNLPRLDNKPGCWGLVAGTGNTGMLVGIERLCRPGCSCLCFAVGPEPDLVVFNSFYCFFLTNNSGVDALS